MCACGCQRVLHHLCVGMHACMCLYVFVGTLDAGEPADVCMKSASFTLVCGDVDEQCGGVVVGFRVLIV